jgi:hypothetical protein
VEEIRSGSGTQFAPVVVRAFESLGQEVWRGASTTNA